MKKARVDARSAKRIPKRTIRVLHILNELKPSGAEVMLRQAAPSWRQVGVETLVLSTGAAIGPYAEAMMASGCHVIHEPFRKTPLFFWRVRYLILTHRIDVVHIHCERGHFWYAVTARIAGIAKIVRTIHAVFAFRGLVRFRKAVQRKLLRQADVEFVSVSEAVRDSETSHFRNPTDVILNWYDDGRIKPATDEERRAARQRYSFTPEDIVVLSIGNCTEGKNHQAIIEALAEIPNPKIKYLHVGESEETINEVALARALNVTKQTKFLGHVDDVVGPLHATDIFVMPSHSEGFGIAALEAMGAGLPVILSEVSGLADFRRLGGSVYWCNPDTQSIATAIRCLSAMEPTERWRAGRDLADRVSASLGSSTGINAYARLYGATGDNGLSERDGSPLPGADIFKWPADSDVVAPADGAATAGLRVGALPVAP